MTFFEVLNNISVIIQIILFVALIIVVISLSGYIKKLMIKVEGLQDDVNKFKTHIEPLVDDTQKLVAKMNSIFEKVDDNMDTVKNTIEKVKDSIEDVIIFKNKIQNTIETPILDTLRSYAAMVKGIKVFFEKMRSPKMKYLSKSEYETPVYKENIEEEKNLFDEEIQDEFNDINKEEISPILIRFKYTDKVKKVSDVVAVDDIVPGCPMDENTFLKVLDKYLKEFKII